MTTFLIVLILIICVLMVLIILAQNSKGGGLTGNIGTASQIIGTRRTTDWLEKTTWTLVALLFVLSLGVNAFIDRREDTGFTSPNIERAKEDVGPGQLPETLDIPEVEPAEEGGNELLEETPVEEAPATENE